MRTIGDIQQFRSALEGTHPAIVVEVEKKARLERLRNLKDEDLTDWVVYYPHIPKAVHRLLKARDPNRYHDNAYTIVATKGSGVQKGQVIARYGDFQVTAPFDGRLEMLGDARPGLHEWPDLQEYRHIDGTEEEQKIANLNSYALVFPSSIPEKEAYAFALRPIRNQVGLTESKFNSFTVRPAFDHGQVYLGMKRPEDIDKININLGRSWKLWTKQWKQPYAFYSIIDMAVYNLKDEECGTPVPENLRTDSVYRKELIRYWDLINNAHAMMCCLGE